MCRYAMIPYKPHYACFSCRKTFKRRLLSDITECDQVASKEAKCPECGSLMANMGKDFKAPKKEAIKEWKQLELLYSVGITFHSCGCSGPGYIPNTPEQLIKHFEKIGQTYQQQLDFWRRREEPVTKYEIHLDKNKNWSYISRMPDHLRKGKEPVKNEEARNFWIGRIKELEQKIAQIKVGL